MSGLATDNALVAEDVLPLTARASKAGLTVLAAAQWPEPGDEEPPRLAGFVHSTFSPLVAGAAARCLQRRPESAFPAALGNESTPVTAIVLVSPLGDADSAAHVGAAVDAGTRVGPLFFFQSVPNAVLGHVAARWRLTGPVVCVGGADSGLEIARDLLADGDADEVLVIEQPHHDAAAAVLVVDGGHA
jgi:hypothetical protein